MTYEVPSTMPLEGAVGSIAGTAGVSLAALRRRVAPSIEFRIIDSFTFEVSLEALRRRAVPSVGLRIIDSFTVRGSGTSNDVDAIGKELRNRLVGASTAHKFIPFTQGAKEFNIVLSRIEQLWLSEDDFKPTDYAYRKAISLIYDAYRILDRRFTRAAVAVDEDGSIVIYWKKPERNFHLTIPASEHGSLYIYHRENGNYGTDRNVSGASLARWLQWFMRV